MGAGARRSARAVCIAAGVGGWSLGLKPGTVIKLGDLPTGGSRMDFGQGLNGMIAASLTARHGDGSIARIQL